MELTKTVHMQSSSTMSKVRLCIVLPCYNEEDTLNRTIEEVTKKIRDLESSGMIEEGSHALFVDDGSTDSTWKLVIDAHEIYPDKVRGVRFAANRGKEIALWAGVCEGRKAADVVACMDADLQFDINALDAFLAHYYEGYELIYGIKRNRGREPWLKTIFSAGFYKIMQLLGSPVCNNHTDYCLISKNVCNALSEYEETYIIFRGLLRKLGFRQKGVYFNVLDRQEGETHFSYSKLLSLSINAITAFSAVPLRMIAVLGLFVFLVGMLLAIYSVVVYVMGTPPSGYTTLACSMWILGGMGMLCMGVVGEYIGKLYIEVKRRPRYCISEQTDNKDCK